MRIMFLWAQSICSSPPNKQNNKRMEFPINSRVQITCIKRQEIMSRKNLSFINNICIAYLLDLIIR